MTAQTSGIRRSARFFDGFETLSRYDRAIGAAQSRGDQEWVLADFLDLNVIQI